MTIQELYKQFGGNYEQVSRIMKTDQLIERYICRFEESGLMERLRAAAETMDASGIFEAAHAMKGVCGNLGLDALAEGRRICVGLGPLAREVADRPYEDLRDEAYARRFKESG
jgi:HPt (histidine-containing phosphotransfer) domain-containing protein